MSDFNSTTGTRTQQQIEVNEQQASKTFNSFTAYAVGGVFSIVSVGAILLVVYLIYRCFRNRKHGLIGFPSINVKTTTTGAMAEEQRPALPDSMIRNTTIDNFLNEIAREKPIRFTAQQLDGYTQNKCAEIGAGGFGAVYKGMLSNGLDIAVKVLHNHVDDEVTEQQFMAEVGTLWRTNHANLIRLIGYCFEASERALVYELMPNGSVDTYLFHRRRRVVGPAALLAIALGVARGLRYLHEECQKKIIHYDVKASNVLLDYSLNPKLTDFGIAQLLSRADKQASLHAMRGTSGYMAPEVIHVGKAPITEKCDVYSFGMLLFELIGRRKNMDNSAPDSHKFLPLLAWTMYDRGELLDLMKECHYPVAVADEEQWKETAERMCKVAFMCVQEQPEARPTMSMAVNMLEGHLEIPPPVYPFGWMYPQEASAASGSKSEVAAATLAPTSVLPQQAM